jgi:hypothetical protein
MTVEDGCEPMTENAKQEGPYYRERWESPNESIIVGPACDTFPGVFTDSEAERIVPLLNTAYAAGRASRHGLVAALERYSDKKMWSEYACDSYSGQMSHFDWVHEPHDYEHGWSIAEEALAKDEAGK